MKKLIAMMLAVLMLLCMTACGAEEETNADLVITRAPVEENETEAPAEDAEEPAEETEAPVAAGGVFAYVLEGVEIIPGEPFDASALPEAASVYTVPSCALEGTDNVYNYGTVEVTAYDEGEGEHVYSVYFIDPNITTPEGLALGDDMTKVVELYGEDYVEDGTSYTYTKGNTMLIVIEQNGVVGSIEYRMNVQ